MEQLVAAYKRLVQGKSDFYTWANTRNGINLWIDGHDALSSIDATGVARYAAALSDIHRNRGRASKICRENLNLYLESFDDFISVFKGREEFFFPALALGLCVVDACGSAPIQEKSAPAHEIINDSLMMLLSRTYRAARFTSYNDGVTLTISHRQEEDYFFPELRRIRFGIDYFLPGDVSKIQHYNVNHDVFHIVLFADAYLPFNSERGEQTGLLVNAEEFCCGVDLIVINELKRHKIDLHVLKEFRGIDPKFQNETSVSVAERVASSVDMIQAYQSFLKKKAQDVLAALSPSSRTVPIGSYKTVEDLHGWISEIAIHKHVSGTIKLTERNENAIFREQTASLKPDRKHLANLRSAITFAWDGKALPLGLTCPSLSEKKRTLSLVTNSRRSALYERAFAEAKIKNNFSIPVRYAVS